jgi:hypothetical protein
MEEVHHLAVLMLHARLPSSVLGGRSIIFATRVDSKTLRPTGFVRVD